MSNHNVTIDRHKYVGGSDLPTILGLNIKYGTSVFEFAKEKAGIIPKSFKGNQFTKYGQLMEPVIRDYINAKYGTKYLEDTIIDNERGYRGNTDGIDREANIPIIEIKTFGEELDVDYYMGQCQFYMETFNQPKCLLVGYKRPNDFYTGVDYELENDDSYFNLEFDENNIVEYEIDRDTNLWSKIEGRIITFKNAVEYLKQHKEDYTEDMFNKVFYGTDLVTKVASLVELKNGIDIMGQMQNDYNKLLEEIYNIFDEKDIKSFENDILKITKVNPTSYDKVSVDTAKLKEDGLYEKYKITKKVNKKGYILITPKKETKE